MKHPTTPRSLAQVEILAFYATPPTSPAAYRILAFDSPLGGFKAGRSGGMEGDEQQRRQYEQPNYPRSFVPDLRGASGSSIPDALDTRAGSGDNVSERLRQSQLIAARTPTPSSITPSGATPQELAGYGYQPAQQYAAPQMQGTSLQYNPDYAQIAQRQQQQFPHYTSQIMYSVSPQTQQQSPYETVPQYPPRQTAALEVLSTQFGVPQYYVTGETTSAPVPASMAQQYTPAQFQPQLPYQPQASNTQSSITSTYTPGMADFPQPSASEVSEPEDQDTSTFDRLHGEYQVALKRTFESTCAGRLAEAGRSLLEISEWLLGHAGELGRLGVSKNSSGWLTHCAGLLHDDQALHAGRIKLWNEFNTCWLAVLQTQKDGTQRMLNSARPPSPPRDLIQEGMLERMGDEVVRLCDIMERHGLVDYQMGVWEEEIISSELGLREPQL